MNMSKGKSSDELGHIGFNAGKARKRATQMLAPKLGFRNETELLKALLDEKIKEKFPDEYSLILEEEQNKSPKAPSQRKAQKQSAHD